AFSAALAIVADIARNATIPEDEMERERSVILDEWAAHSVSAAQSARDILYRNAFSGHPYSRSPGGAASSIRKLQRSSLVELYRRCFRPDRCILALAGDLSLAGARAIVGRCFGDWRASPEAERALPTFQFHSAPPVEAEVKTAGSAVGIAFLAPAAQEETAVCVAEVLAALLRARLGTQAGSAERIVVTYSPRIDRSLLVITVEIPAATLSTLRGAEASIQAALENMRSQPIPEQELEVARTAAIARKESEIETCAGASDAIGYSAIVGGANPFRHIELMKSLSYQTINATIPSLLDARYSAIVLLEGTSVQ
ncbi:MAG TPA: insulinase family protein, partial [Chthonomonadales bacterium]|nr:insulinase family protein [Chthonomonadales bacterium]